MHKISIIVPCYKVERYLNRCINSIVSQTLHDIEIILVDDLSPDSTPQMCDEWAARDSRIKVIHKANNEGLGMARNTGMDAATGEYISFVDSDDCLELDMMERLYNECKKDNLDIIYSEFNVDEYPGFRVVERPERLYVGKNEIEELRLDVVGAEPTFISGVKYHCSACKGLYRYSVIKENRVRFLSEREYISEDMMFNLNALYYAKRVKIVPWQFYHYCLNGASLTHTYRADRWEKLLKMLDAMNTPDLYDNKDELHLRLTRTAIFYTMNGAGQEKKRSDIGLFKKLRNVRLVIENEYVQRLLDGYPIMSLPIKWKIYTVLLKYKLTLGIYSVL